MSHPRPATATATDPDRRALEIAGRQANVIARAQALAAGLSRATIANRVRRGHWRRVHRGVYLLGAAPPTPVGRAWAAALACAPDAVVSHRSAAELWQLLDPEPGDVEVTVANRRPRPRSGIRVHRVDEPLAPGEVLDRDGLALTSPARVVCDLAADGSAREAERAFNEARARRLLTDRQLRAVIARMPTRNGAALVRDLLEGDPGVSRSTAQRRLLSLLAQAELPRPQRNARVCHLEVDLLWPRERLVLEADGHTARGHRLAFERDRRRDQRLVAAGYRVIRVTWRQLREQPLLVVAAVARALGAPPE